MEGTIPVYEQKRRNMAESDAKRDAGLTLPENQENAKDLLDEFNAVRQQSNARKNPYQHIFDWFKNKFPEYGKPVKKAS